ncbi:hypothetical protein FQR65_LT18059 [Abscondita terminalis]|nr:hypothetical protein FQR65_LT18059 [Abscondita terminalis]
MSVQIIHNQYKKAFPGMQLQFVDKVDALVETENDEEFETQAEAPLTNSNDTSHSAQTSCILNTPQTSRASSTNSICQQNTSTKKKTNAIEQKRQELLHLAHKTLSKNTINTEAEYHIAGESIGYQLKAVEGHQRIIAEKLITDVMFYAKMGKLTEDCSINIPSNSQSQPIHLSAQQSQQPQGYAPNSGFQSSEGSTYSMLMPSQCQNGESTTSQVRNFFCTYEPQDY